MINSRTDIWWVRYRKEKYRSYKVLNREMIFRKSFSETMKEFLSNWTVCAIKHVTNPKLGLERIMWLGVFAAAIITLCIFLNFIWSALSIPLIVSMDSTTYPIDKIDFPAVAICNTNRISKRRALALAKDIIEANKLNKSFRTSYNETLRVTTENLVRLGQLINFENTYEIMDHLLFNSTMDVVQVMKLLAPNCSELLIRCAWKGKRHDCHDMFKVRRTSRGHCCVFNYVLDTNAILDQNFKVKNIERQVIPGNMYGLAVVADAQVDDYAYPLHSLMGFDVILFDPRHFPDVSGGRILHHFVEANSFNRFYLNSRVQIATSEVRKYSSKTRNCLFNDEWPSEYGSMYSMPACLSKCRIRTIQALCKCTPYYLPIRRSQGAVCSGKHLDCLNKNKEKVYFLYPKNPETWTGLNQEKQDSADCTECLPDCEHTFHAARGSKVHFDASEVNSDVHFKLPFLKNINLANKSFILVYQNTPDGTLDRLDIVLYWFEFLSNFGGFAGILLGLTCYSAYECIYYWIFFFSRKIFLNRQKYSSPKFTT